MVRPRWKLEAKRVSFCSSGLLNLQKPMGSGEKETPTQELMVKVGHGQFPAR
jgi:hypothetical protein